MQFKAKDLQILNANQVCISFQLKLTVIPSPTCANMYKKQQSTKLYKQTCNLHRLLKTKNRDGVPKTTSRRREPKERSI